MIDKTAIISKKAKIGKKVSVGPYSIIGEGVVIKDNVWIGAHVAIEKDTEIGKGCSIHNYASVGTDPQDLRYKGEKTKLKIGKNNIIREFTTLNRGTPGGGGITTVGDNNFLMAYSHIAHDCHIGDNVIIANAVNLAGHITLEDFVVIGGQVVIHQFARIGKHAIIGGASAVAQDVPPFMNAVGNRAVLHGLNSIGLKRRGFSPETIRSLKKAYALIFRTKRVLKDVLAEVEDTLSDSEEVMYLVDFIKKSERGFIRSCKKGN
jgi:UDP-N-acetylglucosamine acyltransferase